MDWAGRSVPGQQKPRQHTLGWGWAGAAAESAGEVAEDEAQFFVEEEEASADVNVGRVAGGTAPYTL